MAPVTSGSPLDLRSQTIENCRFFSRPDAVLSLVIAKEPLGNYKAVVLRAEDGQREALLSETGANASEAVQALHVKSAEAVQNYIATNGFEFVPILKKRAAKAPAGHNAVDDDGGEDGEDADHREGGSDNESVFSGSATSTVTMSEEAGSACESLSDDETVSVSSAARRPSKRSSRSAAKKKKSKSAKNDSAKSKAARRSRSESPSRFRSRSPSQSPSQSSSQCPSCFNDSEEELDDDVGAAAAPGTGPLPSPPRFRFPRGRGPPPPPPPGWQNASPPPMGWQGGPFAPQPASHIPGFKYIQPLAGQTAPPQPRGPPSDHSPAQGGPVLAKPERPKYNNNNNNNSNNINNIINNPNSPPYLNMPMPMPMPAATPTEMLHPVRLVIKWRGHGEQRALELARLSVSGIQEAAVSYIRRQPGVFQNVQPHELLPSRLWALRATVRSATIDGEQYDISGYQGDALHHLVDCSASSSGSSTPTGAAAAAAAAASSQQQQQQQQQQQKTPRFDVYVETMTMPPRTAFSHPGGLTSPNGFPSMPHPQQHQHQHQHQQMPLSAPVPAPPTGGPGIPDPMPLYPKASRQ